MSNLPDVTPVKSVQSSSSDTGKKDLLGFEKSGSQVVENVLDRIQLKTPLGRNIIEQIGSELSSGDEFDHDSLADILSDDSGSDYIRGKRQNKAYDEMIGRLRKDLNEKIHEIDQLKDEMARQSNVLEENLAQERHNHNMQIVKMQAEKKQAETRIQGIINQSHDMVKKLNAEVERLKATKPLYDEQTELIQGYVSEEPITDGEYQRLAKVAQSKLTLKEFIKFHFYGALKDKTDKIRNLERENESLQENYERTQSSYDNLTRKFQHEQAMNEQQVVDLTRERGELEKQVSVLTIKRDEASRKYDDVKYKEEQFDTTKQQLEDLRAEHVILQSKLAEFETKANHEEKRSNDLQSQYNTLKQQTELLKQDKMYLSNDNQSLKTRVQQLLNDMETKEAKIDSLKATKNDYQEKLLNVKEQVQLDAQRDLAKQITTIQQETQSEIATLRQLAKENLERETKHLRDQKETAERAATRMEQQLSSLQEQHDTLLTEHRTLGTRSERLVTAAQTEAKIKGMEAERSNAQLLEINNKMRLMEKREHRERERHDIIQTAYYKLEMESNHKIVQLQADVSQLRGQLSRYQDMERALDDGIEKMGNVPDSGKSDIHAVKEKLFNLTPSDNHHRIRYCLQLVNRVASLERDLEEAQKQISQQDATKDSLNKELVRARDRSRATQQPYHFLVATIESRDKELKSKEAKITKLESNLKKYKTASAKWKKKKKQLQHDIQTLLDRQAFSSQIHAMLSKSSPPVRMDTPEKENMHPIQFEGRRRDE